MDCFFVLNGTPVHVATNGGIVHARLGTVAELKANQNMVARMEGRFRFSLNSGFLSTLDAEDFPSREELGGLGLKEPLFETLFENTEYSDVPFHWKVYSHSFVEMARKGFWSFDRIGEGRFGLDDYMLVAWPADMSIENKSLIGPRFEMECCEDWPRGPVLKGVEWTHWPLMEIVKRAGIMAELLKKGKG
ncbi:MAG: hypothetical protein J6X55_04790 [Victivallales bacterium]|nr:hypothetical protein [Victivallales bacterium]